MAAERIGIFHDERVLLHDTGAALHETELGPWLAAEFPHTEGPARIRAMTQVLRGADVADRLVWHPGRLATTRELARVHDATYVERVEELCTSGGGWVTTTTRLGADSFEPLLAAAGTALEAGRAVLEDRERVAYALVRPPGHHAQTSQADGYCMFNHAALVVDQALRSGIDRVAVVDFDVHHGNGTQEIFYGRDDVVTVSVHMDHGAWGPSHPQTGRADEVGRGVGAGHNVNLALPLGAGDRAYLRAVDEVVAPVLRDFAPGLLVVASGQDASAFDPNGRHNVTMSGFRGLGQRVHGLASELCGGRLVGVQEGGHNPAYAAYCLLATVEGVLDAPATPDPLAYVPDQDLGVDEALARTRERLAPYWPGLGA